MKRAVLLLLLLSSSLAAQQSPRHELGFAADKVYQITDRDAVNTFNGNLTISIPLGPSYPVNGDLSYALTLVYNSDVWDFELGGGQPYATPSRVSNAGMGWIVSLGRIVAMTTTSFGGYQSPDGNIHRFFDTLHDGEPSTAHPPTVAGVGYTRDNTYLRGITWSGGTMAVQSPDGISRTFDAAGELTTITDSFNNFVTITRLDAQPAACSATGLAFVFAWQITDSRNARTNYVCFKDTPYPVLGTTGRLIGSSSPRPTAAAHTTSSGTPP